MVRADDAVLWSGSDGGRRSFVRGQRSFNVAMVYHIFWVLSPTLKSTAFGVRISWLHERESFTRGPFPTLKPTASVSRISVTRGRGFFEDCKSYEMSSKVFL